MTQFTTEEGPPHPKPSGPMVYTVQKGANTIPAFSNDSVAIIAWCAMCVFLVSFTVVIIALRVW
jgi:hypothetical protein